MPTGAVNPEHHIARDCGHQKLHYENGALVGVSIAAFFLRGVGPNRPAPETYLSASWLEHFAGTVEEQLKQLLPILRKKKSLGPKSALLRMKVSQVLAAGTEVERALKVQHKKKSWHPAYAAVEGLPHDNSDLDLLELLTKLDSLTVHVVGDLEAM